MNNLQLLWFFLIGVLFSGYFFLEGFDYGVGMSMHTLAKNEKERDQLVATIGPVWDGNEVWLITAGGAMFASFPFWYASLFSGYYLLLFTILFGLIIRGVSFEFRHKVEPSKKNFWNWTLTIGSFIVPFFKTTFSSTDIQKAVQGNHLLCSHVLVEQPGWSYIKIPLAHIQRV